MRSGLGTCLLVDGMCPSCTTTELKAKRRGCRPNSAKISSRKNIQIARNVEPSMSEPFDRTLARAMAIPTRFLCTLRVHSWRRTRLTQENPRERRWWRFWIHTAPFFFAPWLCPTSPKTAFLWSREDSHVPWRESRAFARGAMLHECEASSKAKVWPFSPPRRRCVVEYFLFLWKN